MKIWEIEKGNDEKSTLGGSAETESGRTVSKF